MAVDLAALVRPERCAVVTSEVQSGVVGERSALPELAAAAGPMVEAVARLCRAARAAGVQVVHCTAARRDDGKGSNTNARLFAGVRRSPVALLPGSAEAAVVPALGPEPGDLVLSRLHGLSPMAGTDLDPVLRNLGVTTVIVTGVSVNVAVTNLVMDAVNRGYQVVVPRDGVAGLPPAYAEAVVDHTLALLATITTVDALMAAWSGGRGVTAGVGALTIPGALDATAARIPEGEAVVDGSHRLTWGELRDRSVDAARAFVAAGLEPGDRVGLWAPNCWEWVVALVGLHRAGGVAVPLNSRYKGDEAAWILRRSRARLLVTVDRFLDLGYAGMLAGHDLPDLAQVVVARDAAPPGTVGWDAFLAAGRDVDPDVVAAGQAALGPDTVSDIIFTSGTTGRPKGVETTHGQAVEGFTTWAELAGLTGDDRYLIVNPFFHSFGYKAGIVACLLTGATMVPLPVFDVDAVIATIAAERITVFPGPPALYQTILNHPARGSLARGTLRIAVTGAAPVPVSLVERMRRDLGFDAVLTAYGLSEATGIVSMCRQDDDAETISTSSGRAIPGVEVRIVDGAGVEVPRGQPGEILVRGFNVMKGYFEDPERTAEAVDPDGWLRTGDVGTMDERGYLDVTDRTKDMFICGGFNAYPAEIESVLSEHPAVAQAAVVGVPDERLGEVGFAWLVPATGTEPPTEAEVVAWSRERMANFKAPRHVRWTGALPLNPSGKIQKFVLRDDAVAALAPTPPTALASSAPAVPPTDPGATP